MVSTGKVERTWRWSGYGFQTIGLKDLLTGREYAKPVTAVNCDWGMPGAISDSSRGELLDISVVENDDEGFSNQHLQVMSTIKYPDGKLMVQHVIWVYPNATGIRTQLRVKALWGFDTTRIKDDEGKINYYGNIMATPGPRSEYIPLGLREENQRRYWEYYNNPGGRHDPGRQMLEERVVAGYPLFQIEDNDCASGLSIEYNKGNNGVCLVKESPKCVNQAGHYTGSFYSGPEGVSVTGWGLSAKELVTDRFRECWATWTILWDGGNDGMQLALKRFDRTRYPVFPDRDMFILSNTWGAANPGREQFTDEAFLRKEIPALAMVPYQVLMQHWLMSKYFNSNKLQVLLQNPKRVNPKLSDAPDHSHSYCFAMGFPLVPCFSLICKPLPTGDEK